jgi:hypothetical protein
VTVSEAVPERIVDRKVVFYKTLVDPSVAKITGEKLKANLFVRMRLFRPKPEEVQFESIDKFYEPYIAVSGRYTIEYYRHQTFTLHVDDGVREVILFDRTLVPQPSTTSTPTSMNEIAIEGAERLRYEDEAYLILDKQGQEIPPIQVPSAPSEAAPAAISEEFREKIRRLELSPDMEVGVLRSKLVKRPPTIQRVVRELFEVSERTVIYTPIYDVTFKNTRTEDTKTIQISGVTSKLL